MKFFHFKFKRKLNKFFVFLRYDKTENMGANGLMQYTHLLVEARSKYSLSLRPFSFTHTMLDFVEGFWHVSFNYHHFPPMEIKTRPQVFLLKRKADYADFLPKGAASLDILTESFDLEPEAAAEQEVVPTEEVQTSDGAPQPPAKESAPAVTDDKKGEETDREPAKKKGKKKKKTGPDQTQPKNVEL